MNGVYVKLDATLKNRLMARAKEQKRTQGEQVRRYLEFAMLAEDNPHLPTQFINGILQSLENLEAEPTEGDTNSASEANAEGLSLDTLPG